MSFFLCSSARSCFLTRTFIFYIPPVPFYYFFSLFIYASVLFLLLYISHALFIFYFLSFISYSIVSVIFRARKRLLMLRLLFLRVQLRLCFLLLLPFLFFYQNSVSTFSSFFLFSFLAKRLHFFFHFLLAFLQKRRFMLCLLFLRVQLHFSFLLLLLFLYFFTKAPLLLSPLSSFSLFS